ncbi:hypothetical protein [Paenarthrobacter sp. Y-19]|uniref:hypothetical protein n=1 Tax=Paenarthrobacter sp. Y-19 TaxID=3031125 RepID=UPI0023DBE606|nr:hypothetical protein [Paenarthrobacter sp. Y-19]
MTTTPETFDVEAWLTDAALPEESAVVYKRADVISELTDLKRRIELARAEEAEPDFERTATQALPSQALADEYEALLKTFSDSALTVYVQALPQATIDAMRAKAAEDFADVESTKANVEFGYRLIAASIVAVKPANGERVPASFTPESLKALEEAVGVPQVQLITIARKKAQDLVPEVDADFLHKPSGTATGRE